MGSSNQLNLENEWAIVTAIPPLQDAGSILFLISSLPSTDSHSYPLAEGYEAALSEAERSLRQALLDLHKRLTDDEAGSSGGARLQEMLAELGTGYPVIEPDQVDLQSFPALQRKPLPTAVPQPHPSPHAD